MTKTVFVTGGAGYVGSHCCQAFAAAGWAVVVYDNLSRGWRDFVRWGPLVKGDILDQDALGQALQTFKPDIVAHFAALAYVAESMAQPALYYRVNTAGTLALLAAMRKAGVNRLLYSSTCATYGLPLAGAIDEAHPQNPINPYGWSKLFAERMLADHRAAYGLRYLALRYFNAAGADAGGAVGERHEPEPHVIPLAIRAALGGERTFVVRGDDFDTPDGTAVRDYIHVTDLARAHCLALGKIEADDIGEAINLGTGVGASVLEIARQVERVLGRPLIRRIGARRPGDPDSLVADPRKAQRLLHWSPEHSAIENIIATAWRWQADDARVQTARS